MAAQAHTLGNIANANGLLPDDAKALKALIKIWNKNRNRNRALRKYKDYKVTGSEVNIGIAVPDELAALEIACPWPDKAVQSLQMRSIFDYISTPDGDLKAMFAEICNENHLKEQYAEAVEDELTIGTTFFTLTMGDNDRAIIRKHTVEDGAARWDGEHDCELDGFFIVDSAQYNNERTYRPSLVNMYTSENIIVLRRVNSSAWEAEYHPHKMGRPLFKSMSYRATQQRPFGQSRITPAVQHLTDAYLREFLRLEIGAELFTSPQKVLLNADDEMVDDLSGNFKAYMTSMLAIGQPENETGEGSVSPELIQIAASSMQPHIEVMRCLAGAFSACTNVPISELGIVQDNPSSAEAIYQAKEALVIEAKQLNEANGLALCDLVLLAYCMNYDIAWGDLVPTERAIKAKFRNPATPSIVSQADAMMKIATVLDGFAQSRMFLSAVGFDDAEIDEITADMSLANSNSIMSQVFERMGQAQGGE